VLETWCLYRFPYRDRLAERARPAVVVSADTYNQHGDVVVAAITSHVHGWPWTSR